LIERGEKRRLVMLNCSEHKGGWAGLYLPGNIKLRKGEQLSWGIWKDPRQKTKKKQTSGEKKKQQRRRRKTITFYFTGDRKDGKKRRRN